MEDSFILFRLPPPTLSSRSNAKKIFFGGIFFFEIQGPTVGGNGQKANDDRRSQATKIHFYFQAQGDRRKKKWHKGATAIGLAATLRGRRCHFAVRVPRERQRGKKKRKKTLMPYHSVLSGHVYPPSVSKTLQPACTCCCQLNLSYSNCTSTHRWDISAAIGPAPFLLLAANNKKQVG